MKKVIKEKIEAPVKLDANEQRKVDILARNAQRRLDKQALKK